MAEAKVIGPVLPGCIVVLTGVFLGGDYEEEGPLDQVAAVIEEVSGHKEFGIMWFSDDGDVEVWGPDTDVRARLAELLSDARAS